MTNERTRERRGSICKRLFVIVVAVVFCAPSAIGDGSPVNQPFNDGTTYYVDSVAGSDQNLGTSVMKAWQTLSRVNAMKFKASDHILLKSGSTWVGQLWPKGSGSPMHPIVVDKYGGDAQPVINGSGLAEDAVLLKNQEYWEIRNLEISNTGPKPATRRGVHLVADNVGELHHLYVHNLFVHDVNGSDEDKVNGGIHYNAIGDRIPSRFIDLRIEGNRISHVDRSGIFGWSTHWQRSKWFPSLNVVIRNNNLDDIGGDGIVNVATEGAIVEHNVVAHANQRSEGYDVGIWPWSADNTIVQFNEVYGTKGQRDGEGFDSDWNSRGTIIQYNYSHDNDGGFLLICDDGASDPRESVGNNGTIVRYNISQNDHHRGINLSGPVKNARIYNNTIYVGKDEKVDVILYSNWEGWATNSVFYNNIFYVEGHGQFSYGVARNVDGAHVSLKGLGQSRGNRFDSNVYYGVEAQSDPRGMSEDPWLENAGRGKNGIETLSGYALRQHSPAIDSGRTIDHSGGRDFLGTKVPQCLSTDRGAIEAAKCQPSPNTSR